MPGKKAAGAHLLHEVLVGGISNALFNALAAWLLLRGGSNLTFGGDNSFAVDVVETEVDDAELLRARRAHDAALRHRYDPFAIFAEVHWRPPTVIR